MIVKPVDVDKAPVGGVVYGIQAKLGTQVIAEIGKLIDWPQVLEVLVIRRTRS